MPVCPITLEFEDATVNSGDGSKILDAEPCKRSAEYFGSKDHQQLLEAMTKKKLVIGNDVTVQEQNAQKASNSRDSMAKLIYGKLFKHLIKKMNESLVGEDVGSSNDNNSTAIGILDIAGFECFEKNSLEQLFINLSNETLQLFFNNFVFKSEIADYEREGVKIDKIDFADNTDILELIQGPTAFTSQYEENKNGQPPSGGSVGSGGKFGSGGGGATGNILGILDNEISVPKATDSTYIAKMGTAFAAHKRYKAAKIGGSMEFTLTHYAGPVTYTVTGWLQKNMDEVLE